MSGRLDSSDAMPDSWYALSGAMGKFLSLGHTSTISALDDDHPHTLSSDLNVLELYKFNDLGYAKDTLAAGDQYLIRHPDGNGGAVLQYGPLSALQSNVDTRMPLSVDQNSIDYAELSGDSYLQLYKFPDDEELGVQAVLSDNTDVVLRHRYSKTEGGITQQVVEVDYISAGAAINPIPDSENGCGYYSSLEKFGREDGGFRDVWQVYKFGDLNYKKDLSALNLNGSQVVVREDTEGLPDGVKVRYVPVEQLVTKTDSEGNTSKSVEKDATSHELRLYNFLTGGSVFSETRFKPTFEDASNAYLYFLAKDAGTLELKYYDLKNLSRFSDSDVNNGDQQSIDTVPDAELEKVYYQLHDFDYPTAQTFNFTLKYDDKAYHLTNGLSSSEDRQLLVRNGVNGKDLQYWDFTITAPKVGMTDLTQEVIN